MHKCEASKFASGVKIVLKQGNLKFIQKTKNSKNLAKKRKKSEKKCILCVFLIKNSKFR